jgi:putative NADH-flavin reductase
MRIAVYGATGAIGSAIVDEARERGHVVTGISRRGSEVVGDLTGDALDAAFTTEVAEKHDVIVSAIGPSRVSDDGTRFVDSVANLVATLGDRRLVVVGGAGSLEVDGVRLVDCRTSRTPTSPRRSRGRRRWPSSAKRPTTSTGPTSHRRR